MNGKTENLLKTVKRRTQPSDYPNAVRLDKGLIPVFDAKSLCDQNTSLPLQLALQELDINDPGSIPTDEELSTLSRIFEANCDQVRAAVNSYKDVIEEIVRSLSLDGPGVCVIENVFSEDFMKSIQEWVDDYLARDTSSRKDHFAFGTNKRIWRLPEKMPPPLLISYLRSEAGCEASSPVFNHVLDRFLGQHHIGSLAINQILPGGKAQLTHTDYPPGFYQPQDMRKVFTGYGLESVMPYFSLQAGIALGDMDEVNGSTAVIPYSHAIRDSDWLIAGAKPRPGETELSDAFAGNREFFEAAQEHLVQTRVTRGSCIFFNRKLLHQGGANHSQSPRTALLLQAIMPFGVKMETMETEQTWSNLVKYAEERAADRQSSLPSNLDEEERKVLDKYLGVSKSLREKLHYRLHGPRFPRDMDAASVEEKNN